jgi:hypothetical protein
MMDPMHQTDRKMSPRWIVVGNHECRRVNAFQAALIQRGWAPAIFVSYFDLLSGTAKLSDVLSLGCFVRFESAAEDWKTRGLLLARGYADALAENYPAATTREIAEAPNEAGILLWPRQLFLGFADFMRTMNHELQIANASSMNSPLDIVALFDKPTCQARFRDARIPVPEIIGIPSSYTELRNFCGRDGRFMLKLAHGSGGAGCVALQWNRGRVRAITSLHWSHSHGKRWPYSSQRVRQILGETEIADLIDHLCLERVHLETWLPKARCDGSGFDLRIVTIGGEARHVVPRVSNSPFTNLNLGNRRGDFAQILKRLEPAQREITQCEISPWETIRRTCAQVARQFPHSLYLGMDVLITPQGRHYVLEANAFGDLLPRILSAGLETYAAEIEHWEQHGLPTALPLELVAAEEAVP